jgi:hypothetical protein
MFFGAKQWADEGFPASHEGPHLMKTPMLVDAPDPVTITVASPEGKRLVLAVGLDQRGPQGYEARGKVIRLEPCDPDAKVGDRRVGRRTVFLGGFRFGSNTCVDVTVDVHSDEPTAHETSFGFGRENCSAP